MTTDNPTGARLEAAGRLMAAIAACDPRNRSALLSAALEALAAGAPCAPFLEIREEAADWAALATPQELEAYLDACGSALTRATLPAAVRKRIGDRLTGLAEKNRAPAEPGRRSRPAFGQARRVEEVHAARRRLE